jgi:tetratricopeptide (TPR) repeat protein
MTLSRRFVIALTVLELIVCTGTGWVQIGAQETGPSLVQIRGLVRYSNGQAAEQGIMVTIEDLSHGGILARLQTDERGRFEIQQIPQAVYMVEIHQPGFRDVSQRVDLMTMPTAYVMLTLIPLPSKFQPASAPEGAGNKISAAELALPEGTRKEFEEAKALVENQHEPKKGIPHLEKVIKDAPSFVEAHLLLGTAQMDLGHWKDAQEVFQQTISLDDKSSQAYLALGTCYNEQHKFSEAEKPLLQGLELNPQAATGHYELARSYWERGRWQDAAPHAKKAVEVNPNFPPAHVMLGNVMLRERNAPGALKEFKEYLRLDPKGPLSAPVKDMVGKIEKALAASR